MRTLCSILLMCLMTTVTWAQDKKMTVTSPAFKNNGMIPARYTCKGMATNPPLHISNIPKGTPFISIIVQDVDAHYPTGVTHWLVWDIKTNSSTELAIPENFNGGIQGLNDQNRKGFLGICPDSGMHHYYFTVYAQDVEMQVGNKTDRKNLQSRLEGHILAKAELVGTYKK